MIHKGLNKMFVKHFSVLVPEVIIALYFNEFPVSQYSMRN